MGKKDAANMDISVSLYPEQKCLELPDDFLNIRLILDCIGYDIS